MSSAPARAGPRAGPAGRPLAQRLWAELPVRYAAGLVAAGLLTLPFTGVAVSGGLVSEQIYASVLATGCGLAALLLFEEQLLGRPDPRILGLCGTFLLLMAVSIAWATAYARGVTINGSFFPAQAGWHLALGLGIALSLATPQRLWDWVSARLAGNALTSTVVAAAATLLLAALVLPAASFLTGLLPVRAGAPGLAGTSLGAGWLTLGLEAALLGVAAQRWHHLTLTQRWVLAAAMVAATGMLLALAGGGSGGLGSRLAWAEMASALLMVIGVLSSRMYSGEHQRLMVEIAEREVLRGMASVLDPGESPDQTAERICRELVRLRGAAMAHVVSFPGPGLAIPVASFPEAAPEYPAQPLRPLPRARAVALRQRAAVGPWVERCAPAAALAEDPDLREYWLAYLSVGVHAFAYAPIRRGDRVIGLLVAAAGDRDPDRAASHLAELLPSLADFALASAMVLSPLLDSDQTSGGEAEEVLKAIAEDSFFPVFQPILDLLDGHVIGYEALSRFPGGLAPDRAFTVAGRSGFLPRLELLALQKSLRLGADLIGPGQFLSLNLSPQVLVANAEALGRSLRAWPHGTVIEITEHSEVSDYDQLRAAVASLGPGTRLAVDDAGAGYSSLRHILELRPHFVKLDISLVQGIVGDPAREAMVAGIQHFAERSGCRLIAEGVETPAELGHLRELGVELGQGYLLGRPEARPRPTPVALDA